MLLPCMIEGIWARYAAMQGDQCRVSEKCRADVRMRSVEEKTLPGGFSLSLQATN